MVTYSYMVKAMIASPQYEDKLTKVGAQNPVFIAVTGIATSVIAVCATAALWGWAPHCLIGK